MWFATTLCRSTEQSTTTFQISPAVNRRTRSRRGWRAWLARAGRLLIALGVLMLLFVAYQLWGTGLYTARAQDELASEFRDQLQQAGAAAATTTTSLPPSTTTPLAPTTTATLPASPAPQVPLAVAEGAPVGRMVIPAIGLDWITVHGVSVEDLKKGPGHYPGTPLPGQAGNAAIAGHRTTYGAPFYRINELEPGDEISVTTIQGQFRYVVTGQEIVEPSRVDVLNDFGDNRLTLTSCHPRYSARQRIIVTAALAGTPAPPPPSESSRPPTENPPMLPSEDVPEPTAIQGNLSGDQASAVPAVAWGAVAGAVWLGTWLAGRRWRRWPAYLVGTPVFLVALFVFFENVSRLLPANF